MYKMTCDSKIDLFEVNLFIYIFRKIIAFDKDGRRLAILQDLTKTAGVTCVTTRCQDFLRVNPDDSTFHDVEYMLVDPSCSGSGIKHENKLL